MVASTAVSSFGAFTFKRILHALREAAVSRVRLLPDGPRDAPVVEFSDAKTKTHQPRRRVARHQQHAQRRVHARNKNLKSKSTRTKKASYEFSTAKTSRGPPSSRSSDSRASDRRAEADDVDGADAFPPEGRMDMD